MNNKKREELRQYMKIVKAQAEEHRKKTRERIKQLERMRGSR